MKKAYRRALLFGAILVFIAITPVVVLYALGYRSGFTSADPLPVGVILIETEPAQAEIYVNNRHIGQTPRSIPNLAAGPVQIRIAKEGYATWEKQLTVEPGRATEIRDVRLFPINPTPTTMASNVQSFSLSPSRRLLAAIHTNNTIGFYDQSGERVGIPQIFRSRIQSVTWSPTSDAVLVKTSGPIAYWHSVVAQNGVPRALTPLQNATAIAWDPRIPGRLLFVDTQHQLQAYHIQSTAQATLVSEVSHFAPSAGTIFTIGPNATHLEEHTLQGVATGTAYPLPAGSIRELLVTPQKEIALLLDNGEAWVLDADDRFSLVTSDIKSLAWSPSGKVILLVANDSSLYVFNVSDKRTTLPWQELRLVQRLSRPITDPQWFAGNRHLIYHVDDEIWITEIDTRDHPISHQIDSTNTGAAQATVGEEGQTLFYLKKSGPTTDLIAASLLEP